MQNHILSIHLSITALEIEFTRSQVVAAIPGTFFCAWYALKKHWLANNILGLAFCIQVCHHIVFILRMVVFISIFIHCLGMAHYIEIPPVFIFTNFSQERFMWRHFSCFLPYEEMKMYLFFLNFVVLLLRRFILFVIFRELKCFLLGLSKLVLSSW